MLVHPQFDPIAVAIGPLAVRWYGLMYLVAFLQFWWLGKLRIERGLAPGFSVKALDDLLFYGVLGVVLGGRLGQVLFYEPGYYLAHPLEILAVWKGGMSFHGGFLGVLVAMVFLARKYERRWLEVTDFIAPLVPLGLASLLFTIVLFRAALAKKAAPKAEGLLLGAVTNFFDTLGIGSFAPTMAWFKFRRLVPDRLIPATMLVGHSLPSIMQAFIFLILLVISVPGIIAGIGLLQYRPWARILTIILSVIELLNFPFGTALGFYGIWALLSPEGAALFRDGMRPVRTSF